MTAFECFVHIRRDSDGKTREFDLDNYPDREDLFRAVDEFTDDCPPYDIIQVDATDGTILERRSLAGIWDAYEICRDADDGEAMAAWLSYHGWDLSVAKDFPDHFRGEFDSLEDFVMEQLPDEIKPFFKDPANGFRISPDWSVWKSNYIDVNSHEGVYVFAA